MMKHRIIHLLDSGWLTFVWVGITDNRRLHNRLICLEVYYTPLFWADPACYIRYKAKMIEVLFGYIQLTIMKNEKFGRTSILSCKVASLQNN